MAEEVVDGMQNERHKRTRVRASDEEDNKEESGDFKEGSEEEDDLWCGWKKLLKGLQDNIPLPCLR